MNEHCRIANEIVEEMDIDEDPAFTYSKLLLLADDQTAPRKVVEDAAIDENNEQDVNAQKETSLFDSEHKDSTNFLPYKAYGPENIRRFIELVQEEGGSIAKHAKACLIPRSTAYEILKQWNESDGTVIPLGCIKRPSKVNKFVPKANNIKIKEEHTRFLIGLVDSNPCVTVSMAKEELCKLFEDLQISESGLHKHMTEKIRLSLKNSSLCTMDRDTNRTIGLRYKIITEWKAAGVDFQKNCVFIDEAEFNSHQIRSRAWSLKGEPAQVKVPTQKGVNLSIVGCISPFGTINFSKVEPLKPSDVAKIEKKFPLPKSKKRKAKTENTPKTKVKKGTTAYHIVTFVRNAMDVLDRHEKNGFFIVMDNCRIHHSHYVVEAIQNRGYIPPFMPPYSPFLNPIEECWAKIKSRVRRNPLSSLNTLTPRIQEACRSVTTEDCLGWTRHSETFWDRCLDKETGLA